MKLLTVNNNEFLKLQCRISARTRWFNLYFLLRNASIKYTLYIFTIICIKALYFITGCKTNEQNSSMLSTYAFALILNNVLYQQVGDGIYCFLLHLKA
jgi:hypothetical protein